MTDPNTPWKAQSINRFDVEIVDKSGKEVLIMLNNDRMKFILQAVNKHERLSKENIKMKEVFQLLIDGNMCSHAADDLIKLLLTEL